MLQVDTGNQTATSYVWTIGGTIFADYTYSVTGTGATATSTATLTGNSAVSKTQQTINFYWVSSGATYNVKCKVNFNDGTTKTLSEQFTVIKPLCDFTENHGKANIIGTDLIFSGYLIPSTTNAVGIRFKGKVEIPSSYPNSITGKWFFVQLITPKQSKWISTGSSSIELKLANLYGQKVLDTGIPYDGPYSTGSTYEYTVDSPCLPLQSGIIKVSDDSDFEMYIMFSPDDTGSKYVPLQKIGWHWKGKAEVTNGTWTNTTPVGAEGATAASDTTTHPTWSNILNSAKSTMLKP